MATDTDIRSDVLVIGCGIAGASAALEAARGGLRVTIITKGASAEASNTWHAQGGIVSLGQDDLPELLAEDIIQAGDGISDPRAVEVLAAEGKALVERVLIRELRIPFARSSPAG